MRTIQSYRIRNRVPIPQALGFRPLFDNFPKYKQNGTVIGAFGSNTSKAVEEAGLQLQIKAPMPMAPSMITALDKFLGEKAKK